MGAVIELSNERNVGGEPVADIHVQGTQLHGIRIPEDQVPLAIDEFPALFVAAACAEGETVLTGARELRVKESDRIQVMADGLQTLGIDAQPTEDGMVLQGGTIGSGTVHSHGDHRIAMAFVMAALRAQGAIEIEDHAARTGELDRQVHGEGHLGLPLTQRRLDLGQLPLGREALDQPLRSRGDFPELGLVGEVQPRGGGGDQALDDRGGLPAHGSPLACST